MSWSRPVVLRCDTDGCPEIIEPWEYKIRKARAAAKAQGWAFRGGNDCCSHCESARARASEEREAHRKERKRLFSVAVAAQTRSVGELVMSAKCTGWTIDGGEDKSITMYRPADQAYIRIGSDGGISNGEGNLLTSDALARLVEAQP